MVLDIDKVRGKLKDIYPSFELDEKIEKIEYIRELKNKKGVFALGHNYMTPDIFYGVSDVVGDSLFMAKEATKINEAIILVNGVYFMAETTKVLNPQKKVLIADRQAGCSLADSINAEDVRKLKRDNPGLKVVSYVNCSAEVKAESDICCTSSNALKVVNSIKDNKLIFIPDRYLSANIAKQTDKELISWEKGFCIVHELYSKKDIENVRRQFKGNVLAIAHPECKLEVTENSDFVGSTSQMHDFIKNSNIKNVFLITECGMTDNIKSDFPDRNFIATCSTCPFMKKITLEKIIDVLKGTDEVIIEEAIIEKAKQAIINMINLG